MDKEMELLQEILDLGGTLTLTKYKDVVRKEEGVQVHLRIRIHGKEYQINLHVRGVVKFLSEDALGEMLRAIKRKQNAGETVSSV